MSKYKLKNLIIGFEVPFMDLDQCEGIHDLAYYITDKNSPYFDVINESLDLRELPNLNRVFLYNLIIRLDSSSIDENKFESEWISLRKNISEKIETFLKDNKIIYKKFD